MRRLEAAWEMALRNGLGGWREVMVKFSRGESTFMYTHLQSSPASPPLTASGSEDLIASQPRGKLQARARGTMRVVEVQTRFGGLFAG